MGRSMVGRILPGRFSTPRRRMKLEGLRIRVPREREGEVRAAARAREGSGFRVRGSGGGDEAGASGQCVPRVDPGNEEGSAGASPSRLSLPVTREASVFIDSAAVVAD